MKKPMLVLTILFSCMLSAGSAMAAGYPWKNHSAPYNFLFGNDIDTHQQTRLEKSGELFGFFYIQFTGVMSSDGYPVATHVDCNATPGCTVGWIMRGDPGSATFLYHVEAEHPVWLVNRADIPQPGAYAHFHWLGSDMPMPDQPPMAGYFLELQAVDTFCFIHHMADSASAGETCRDNAGVVVTPGIDIATHVISWPASPPVLPAACNERSRSGRGSDRQAYTGLPRLRGKPQGGDTPKAEAMAPAQARGCNRRTEPSRARLYLFPAGSHIPTFQPAYAVEA